MCMELCFCIEIKVTTSLLQEGINVVSCRYVYQYDFVDTAKEEIQSAGRARAKQARYISMV